MEIPGQAGNDDASSAVSCNLMDPIGVASRVTNTLSFWSHKVAIESTQIFKTQAFGSAFLF